MLGIWRDFTTGISYRVSCDQRLTKQLLRSNNAKNKRKKQVHFLLVIRSSQYVENLRLFNVFKIRHARLPPKVPKQAYF